MGRIVFLDWSPELGTYERRDPCLRGEIRNTPYLLASLVLLSNLDSLVQA